MPSRIRKILPSSITGVAGLACALCCAIPLLLATGVIGGASWAALGQVMPGVTVILVVVAAGTWWWAAQRAKAHAAGCSGSGCSCATSRND